MRTEIFNQANGDRPDVQDVAILITDGEPTREVDRLPGEVAAIKRRGIRIVGVGVTNRVSSNTCILYIWYKITNCVLACYSRNREIELKIIPSNSADLTLNCFLLIDHRQKQLPLRTYMAI